jgi:hypothetical protein
LLQITISLLLTTGKDLHILRNEIAMIDKAPIGMIISINHGVFHLTPKDK